MAAPRDRHDRDEEPYGRRSGDARQQPWPGADTESVDRDAEPGTPLAERAKPQGGVRSEDDDGNRGSDLHPENEATGQRLKDQYERGAREISRMD